MHDSEHDTPWRKKRDHFTRPRVMGAATGGILHAGGLICFDPETPVNVPANSNTVLKDGKKVGVQVAGVANVAAIASTTKKIKDIKVGDKVFARDDKTGKNVIGKVKQVFVRKSDHLISVGLADKSGRIVETLKTTRQHPFYVDGKGWVPAGGLGIGNAIVTRAGPRLFVKSVKWNRRAEGYTVYNFEVEALSGKVADGESTHSYFVGSVAGGAWVHNGRYSQPKFYKKLPMLGSSDKFAPDALGELMEGAELKAGQDAVSMMNLDRIADWMRRAGVSHNKPLGTIEYEAATKAITDGNHRYIGIRLTGIHVNAAPRVPGIKIRQPFPWEDVEVY